MGKLVGLLSSGVGLAMEATSSKGQNTTRFYDASRHESRLHMQRQQISY